MLELIRINLTEVVRLLEEWDAEVSDDVPDVRIMLKGRSK